MASNQTCRACLRALSKQSSLAPWAGRFYASPTSIRHLSISSTRLAKPEPTSSSPVSFASPDTPLDTTPAQSGALTPEDQAYKPQRIPPSVTQRLAKEVRRRGPINTETYIAYGATAELFKECARQADYTIPQVLEGGEAPKTAKGEDLGVGEGWWYNELKLIPTFNTWAQITMLHMYLLTVRVRMFPAQHAPAWHQHLLDHFFYAAEDKMATLHGMVARSVRNKYLKDLFVQWRGVLAAYDEGLVRGDAVLATAVWRNVFQAREDVDARALAEVVAHMRRELNLLDAARDDSITGGGWKFGAPGRDRPLVMRESQKMKAPL